MLKKMLPTAPASPPVEGPQDRPDIQKVLRACRAAYLSVFFFSFISTLLTLATPISMMQIFQRVLPSQSLSTLFMLFVVTTIAIVAQAFLDFFRNKVMGRVGAKFDKDLQKELFRCHLFHSLDDADSKDGAVLKDLGKFKGFMSSTALYSLMDSCWIPLFIFIFFFLHYALGFVVLFGTLILIGLALLNEFLTKEPTREAEIASMRSMGEAQSNLRNAEVVAAMGMLDDLSHDWEETNKDARHLRLKATDRNRALSIATRAVQMLIQLSVISISAYLIIAGEIHPGAMVAAMIMSGRVLAPVVMSVSNWQNVIEVRGAYNRIRQFLKDTPPPIVGMTLPNPKGHVVVEKVSYSIPRSDKLVLSRISFELIPGEITALLGPTAVGKSTLAKIIVGVLKPVMGAVRLDGANIYQWASSDVGKHIGYLPQDVELFNGTVKRNIARMGKEDPTKIVDAATRAGIHQMILNLPKGYDTEIGMGGAFLSGGQRQRLGLARALYGNPRFIVLDEPNANLDSEGEIALANGLVAAKESGASVLLISHRKEVLKMVDKIVYLHEGKVALAGPRDEVLKRLAANQVRVSPDTPRIAPSGQGGHNPQKRIVAPPSAPQASSPSVQSSPPAAPQQKIEGA
ncbi:MAG: type I secretion system permease/ATPase [Alphaproteobacteria bacterium]